MREGPVGPKKKVAAVKRAATTLLPEKANCNARIDVSPALAVAAAVQGQQITDGLALLGDDV